MTTKQTTPLTQLYRDAILSNAVQPVGYGIEIKATHRIERNNPLCGDEIELQFVVTDGVVKQAAFSGAACAICMASTSLLCQHLPGQATTEACKALSGFRHDLADDKGPRRCPEYLSPLLGVQAYPLRIACATLPWEAAVAALEAPGEMA
jgi:nitrogen fixation NifU-like protein